MTEAPVVVGIDGSPATEAAIRWAVAEAAARRTGLLLVHAFSWPGYPRPLTTGTPSPAFRAGADQVLAESIAVARKADPEVSVDGVHIDGLPAEVLQKASLEASIVVLGSRRRTGATGLQLAATAHSPVVVVRPGHGDHVLIGYDSSPHSSAALDFGLEYGRLHDLPVRIAAVPRFEPELQVRPGCEFVDVHHLRGRPADELIQLASSAALLVVGARGVGGFAR